MNTLTHKVRSKSLLRAIAINIIFLMLVIIFCDMKYEVSDDFVMQSIIEGAYGNTYDPHLLYSNMILGYGLKCLYMLFPKVGWYFVMHIVLCFISLTVMSYIVLDACEDKGKNARLLGLLVVVVFVSFFSDDVYILVQFTKTAAVASFSGAALVVYELHKQIDSKRKIVGMLLGTLLCLMGTMVRRGSMDIALLFLIIVFVIDAFYALKGGVDKTSIRKLIIEVLIAVLIYCGAIGLTKVNGYLWDKNESYSNYYHWNSLRASVTDVTGADEEEIRNTLIDAGYTLEDTYMLQSWEFIDQSYFDEETIKNVSSIRKEMCKDAVSNPKVMLQSVWARGYYKYTVFWGVLILALLLLLINHKRWWIAVITAGMAGFQILYCIYNLRIVYRVEYCIFYCAAGTLMYAVSKMLSNDEGYKLLNAIKRKCGSKAENRLILCFVIVLIIVKAPLYIPDDSYEKMTDEEYREYVEDVLYESWNYDVRKYRIDVSHRNPYGNLVETMENDEGHYYLCDFSTTIQLLYYGYKPWKTMPIGYYKDTYSYLGGVTSYFPGCYYVWDSNGIDYINPYKSIANENIRIVDNYYYLTKVRYYNEKYNPQAEFHPIDEIDGMKVWEIR